MRLLFSLLFFTVFILHAQEIKLGMSTALKGPAKQLGLSMKTGVLSYLKASNDKNVRHRYSLTVLDDGYEPNKAAKNVRALIDEHDVLALIGNVGTPTANVTVPIANAKKTLLFGAVTGADILRKNPPERYVINYRASYKEETAFMVEGLLSLGIQPEEIALFTQNDGFGDAGYYGVIQALNKNGFTDGAQKIYHGRYKRNTLNVEDGLGEILDSETDIKAFIIIGTYAPAAKFIQLAKEDFPDALFLNVSFVGSEALKTALGNQSKNVIVTQVVPLFTSALPLAQAYRNDLKKYFPNEKPNFLSFEGYIVAKLFIDALNRLDKKTFSKEEIVDAIESLQSIDIGLSITSGFSSKKHQYSNTVWPTIIQEGEFVPFMWKDLK